MYKIFYFFIFNQSALLRTVTLTIFSRFSRDNSPSTNAKKSSSIDHFGRQTNGQTPSLIFSVSTESRGREGAKMLHVIAEESSRAAGWMDERAIDWRRVRLRLESSTCPKNLSFSVKFYTQYIIEDF